MSESLALSDLIQRVTELDKAATPGPWTTEAEVVDWLNGLQPACAVRHCEDPRGMGSHHMVAACPQLGSHSGTNEPIQNADLIAEYRTLCPQLAEEAQRLQEERDHAHIQTRRDEAEIRLLSERVAELEGQRDKLREWVTSLMASGSPEWKTALRCVLDEIAPPPPARPDTENAQ